jgi:hypothetical protein
MKTPTLITLSLTVVAFAVMVAFLVATDRDPMLFITALVVVVPVIGIGQKTANQSAKTVEQTNGTLSAMRIENASLRVENSQLRNYVPTDVATNIPVTRPVEVVDILSDGP